MAKISSAMALKKVAFSRPDFLLKVLNASEASCAALLISSEVASVKT